MAYATSAMGTKFLKRVEWMWQSNPNPWSKSEPTEWSHYSDVENLIIEDAFKDKQPQALLDNYYIEFKIDRQIFNIDKSKQRPVKRVVCSREDKHLREERFMDLPVGSGRSFSGEYGWVSPFVIAVRRHLKLQPEELPSNKPTMIPMLVEKAARGIIEEGKHIGKEREAEKLAVILRQKKNNEVEEVWKCCAYLYSLESFLYKTLNATMRLVGDEEHEQIWRSKLGTLGPFCLLLWDDPCNKKMKSNKILYRGAKLTDEQITFYKDMAKDRNMARSFQAFTSCSRNRQKAEQFGNTLFIMKVSFAFTADLGELSEYPHEEEELVIPGVCFHFEKVELDHKTNKTLITLNLKQESSRK